MPGVLGGITLMRHTCGVPLLAPSLPSSSSVVPPRPGRVLPPPLLGPLVPRSIASQRRCAPLLGALVAAVAVPPVARRTDDEPPPASRQSAFPSAHVHRHRKPAPTKSGQARESVRRRRWAIRGFPPRTDQGLGVSLRALLMSADPAYPAATAPATSWPTAISSSAAPPAQAEPTSPWCPSPRSRSAHVAATGAQDRDR